MTETAMFASPDRRDTNPLLANFDKNGGERITYEFKIEGMTCVNCSNAIEKGLVNAFKGKGLAKEADGFAVSVVLLMHKMRVTFLKAEAHLHSVTPDAIAAEVEDLGFGAKLVAEHAIKS